MHIVRKVKLCVPVEVGWVLGAWRLLYSVGMPCGRRELFAVWCVRGRMRSSGGVGRMRAHRIAAAVDLWGRLLRWGSCLFGCKISSFEVIPARATLLHVSFLARSLPRPQL